MQFYVHRNGQQTGPFSPDQLRSLLLSGAHQSTDLAWHEGAAGWAPLNSFPAIVGPREMQASSAGLTPPVPGAQLPDSSGLAVASLVLGILAFFTLGLTGIPAVICGHISLVQIKNAAGRLSGNGLAIGGLIAGYFSFIFLVSLLAGIAVPVFAAVRDRAQETKCLSQAKQIALACRLYAMDHKGDFPPTLDELIPDYLPDKQLFDCPIRKDQTPLGYDYFGGKDTDPATKILLSSKATTRTHRRIVATSDGSAMIKREN
jgi:type II secretory pathway pseudopilin PulG